MRCDACPIFCEDTDMWHHCPDGQVGRMRFCMPVKSRFARCTYYGMTPSELASTDCPAARTRQPCSCEKLSDDKLPFFTPRPAREFDEFYCGCIGWD